MTYLDELFDLLYDGTDADWDDKTDGCLHADSEILDDASTEIANLRAGIAAVEWVLIGPREDVQNSWVCPWCHRHKAQGHGNDCTRQKLIS